MIAPAIKWLYFIVDSNNRSYSWQPDNAGGIGTVISNSPAAPVPLPQDPIGWKDVEVKYGTNEKYFSLQRSFSTQLKFVGDGANIIRYFNYMGLGFESDLYVIICKWDRTSGIYILEYNGKLDFSKINDDPYTGITISTLEGGLLRYLGANENVTYEIPCDGRNPAAQKVIFDGVTLNQDINYVATKNKYSYNRQMSFTAFYIIGLQQTVTQGDSSGIIIGNPSEYLFNSGESPTTGQIANAITSPTDVNAANYLLEFAEPATVEFTGTVELQVGQYDSNQNIEYLTVGCGGSLSVWLCYGTNRYCLGQIKNQSELAAKFSVPIYGKFNFNQNDKAFITLFFQGLNSDREEQNDTQLFPTNNCQLLVNVQTKVPSSTAYFLRPLDLLQGIVNKMTYGLYTANSNYFSEVNNEVATCGDALRNLDPASAGIDGYNIKRSFADWFKDYDSGNCLGCKIVNNVLWVEPRNMLYGEDSEIFDLGEVSEFSIVPDIERVFNTIKTGSPDQSYQGVTQNDGKLEVNSSQEWLLPVTIQKKEYDITSKARKDCLGIEFIRQSLPSTGATYNSSDNDVFLIKISDKVQQIDTPIPTAIQITVDAILAIPQIIFPSINTTDIINNASPLVSGYATPNTKVGIIIDGTQEGYCTSDSNGFWTYQVQASLSSFAINSSGAITAPGTHTIAASYTDSSGVVLTGGSSNTTANIIINTMTASNFTVTSLSNNQNIYNNKPLIQGIGPAGSIVEVFMDNILLGTVTVDNSCNWQYQITNPLSDNTHTLTAKITALSLSVSVNYSVTATTVTYPMITSLINGQNVYNSQPIISGVAAPGTAVTLWLDFITVDSGGNPYNIGTGIADNKGCWSITPTISIPDGSHEISTTPVLEETNILESGYSLLRGIYDSITGVTDDTVYNIVGMTPKQCLLAHGSYIQSINIQQPAGQITMTTAAKNKNLVTVSNGVTYSERAAITIGDLSQPFFLPFIFNLKTVVPYTFNQIFSQIPNGYLQFTVKGLTLYALPIGEMTYKPADESAQTWKVLASAKNNLSSLLKISGSFLLIESYNNNMISISNLNPLLIIKYGYVPPTGTSELDIYDANVSRRFESYIHRPSYIQKWQLSDTINLQFITANNEALVINVYNNSGALVTTYTMVMTNNQYVQQPYALQQVSIPLTDYSEGLYKFVFISGTNKVFESYWCDIRECQEGTFLIKYSSTYNLLNGYFNNGWNPMIRVEAMFEPWTPESDFIDYEDEQKDIQLLHAVPSLIRNLIMGKPYGWPDIMASKINEILLLNSLNIENINYVRDPQGKLETNSFNGTPFYWLKVPLRKSINDSNLTISDVEADNNYGGMAATIDGQAFGQATGVINITIQKD